MKVKKLIATLLCSGLIISTLAGCGSGNETGESNTSETATAPEADTETTDDSGGSSDSSGDTVEIHYAYWQATLDPYLEECKNNFEKEHENIKIILEPTGWGEYWEKLGTAATGGSIADVFQMNGPNIDTYADNGVILPLDDYIASSDVDMANYPEAMNGLYNVNGTTYGIPIDWDTIGLWYNKEVFDAAGVSYPTDSWTWEDMTEAAKQLTDADKGVYGISAGYADQGGFYNTVFACGGYIISDDKTTSGFDQEGTKAGIKCWIDLMEAGYSPSQASFDDDPDYVQFMSGKIGMLFAGDWYAATFAAPDADFADKCDVVYLPTINGKRASVIHGKANCISASTANPDAAWAWVEYLAGAEANEILGKTGAAIPAHQDYSHLFFEQYPDYNMDIFAKEAAECAYTYPTSKGFNEWADVVWNELIEVYSLNKSLDDACASITEQMNDILAAQ